MCIVAGSIYALEKYLYDISYIIVWYKYLLCLLLVLSFRYFGTVASVMITDGRQPIIYLCAKFHPDPFSRFEVLSNKYTHKLSHL